MDKSLYIAMTGAKQSMVSNALHANNLANASTTGFKADLAQARAMPVFGETLPSRAYAQVERPTSDLKSGSLIETGRDLDVAVNGDGWIAVQAPDGSEAYTRAGELQVDVNGILRTGSGLPVLGNGAPVALPPASSIEIGNDGTISVRPLGAAANEIAEVDRIKLVRPDDAGLKKGVDGLMRAPDGQPLVADATVRLESGFLESSNVNPVSILTDIIAASRQFEMHVRLMRTAEENDQASARLLQLS